MKKRKTIIFIFFIVISLQVFSQKSLQILYARFGKVKKFEFFINDLMEYKLKGKRFFHENKIVNLQDSLILFENDSVIKLSELKAIRIHRGGHLARTLQEVFFIGGVGFIALNTANNAINSTSPLIDNRAVYISGALVGTSLLIRLFSTHHIRINKNKSLKIIVTDFSKLNAKD
ncbi:MAG: hypothetical protein ACXVNM_06105 [Bacteroidia bacterium]